MKTKTVDSKDIKSANLTAEHYMDSELKFINKQEYNEIFKQTSIAAFKVFLEKDHEEAGPIGIASDAVEYGAAMANSIIENMKK